jgi:hypothetical protein
VLSRGAVINAPIDAAALKIFTRNFLDKPTAQELAVAEAMPL